MLNIGLERRDLLNKLLTELTGCRACSLDFLGERVELFLKVIDLRLEFSVLLGDGLLGNSDFGSDLLLGSRDLRQISVELGNGTSGF